MARNTWWSRLRLWRTTVCPLPWTSCTPFFFHCSFYGAYQFIHGIVHVGADRQLKQAGVPRRVQIGATLAVNVDVVTTSIAFKGDVKRLMDITDPMARLISARVPGAASWNAIS